MHGKKRFYGLLFLFFIISLINFVFPKTANAGGGNCTKDADCYGIGEYGWPCECVGAACGYEVNKCNIQPPADQGQCYTICDHAGGGGATQLPNCNGQMIQECMQTGNCGGGQASGTCGYTSSGVKKTWCRHPSCVSQAPTAATLSAPANGSIVTGNPVHLTWNTPSNWGNACIGKSASNNTDEYDIYVGPSGAISQLVSTPVGSNYYDYTVPDNLIGAKIYWYVKTSNGCYASNTYEPQSATWNFTLQGGIQGKVYYDANGTCSVAQTWNKGGALQAQILGGTSASLVNGAFNLPASGNGPFNLNLIGIPGGYVCSSCSPNCSGVSVNSPSNTNFFLTYNPGPWWQVKDGDDKGLSS